MTGTPEEFVVAVDRWVKQAGELADAFMLEFSQDVAEQVVIATPVDKGYLRGGWYAALGEPGPGPDPIADQDGSIAIARLTLVAGQSQIGDVIYYLNNTAYASHVEYGTARMAPRAYVRSTVARAPQLAAAALARVKGAARA